MYVNQILVKHKKIGPSQFVFGPVEVHDMSKFNQFQNSTPEEILFCDWLK